MTYNTDEIEKLSASKYDSGKRIRFYYFIQYHLHLQLQEAVDYAHKKGIALKGDIPIGIFRNSVDAWTDPGQYFMCWQAGAPPDDFAVKGQNWGFPTYNWQQMQQNHFQWWRQRFEQMSNYFDAFRIDHILGFFRIWSIPMHAVEGILGRFVPALPVTLSELKQKGISFNHDRYCKPFISEAIINEKFGSDAAFIKESFLEQKEDGNYALKEAFNTQRKVEAYFNAQNDLEERERLKVGLFDLISNVIFFEEEGSEEAFHFRISVQHTTSFQQLDEHTKSILKNCILIISIAGKMHSGRRKLCANCLH